MGRTHGVDCAPQVTHRCTHRSHHRSHPHPLTHPQTHPQTYSHTTHALTHTRAHSHTRSLTHSHARARAHHWLYCLIISWLYFLIIHGHSLLFASSNLNCLFNQWLIVGGLFFVPLSAPLLDAITGDGARVPSSVNDVYMQVYPH